MLSTREPAELLAAPGASPPDPYRGTPLGVEAAWCPNGIGVLCAAAPDLNRLAPYSPRGW